MMNISNGSLVSRPPGLLLNMMGVYASLTGLLGVAANGAAIWLFITSPKVRKLRIKNDIIKYDMYKKEVNKQGQS